MTLALAALGLAGWATAIVAVVMSYRYLADSERAAAAERVRLVEFVKAPPAPPPLALAEPPTPSDADVDRRFAALGDSHVPFDEDLMLTLTDMENAR